MDGVRQYPKAAIEEEDNDEGNEGEEAELDAGADLREAF